MKEESYMIIIPANEEVVDNPNNFMDNLAADETIQIQGTDFKEEAGLIVDLLVEDRPYQICVRPETIHEIPPMMRLLHHFTEEEFEEIKSIKRGLGVSMDYNGDYQACFHDQLRIVSAMVPDILAVMDIPSEKFLSGKWVKLAAKSNVPPAPKYLFTVQAILGDDDEVWLHTHGLKRCGMFELEMLYSYREMYNNHYSIIESMAVRMIEAENPVEPGDPVYIGRAGEHTLVVTAIDWREAIKYFPAGAMGGEDDRDDYHSEDTCVMMCYLSPEDLENKKYTPIQVFDDDIKENPIYYYSDAETDRMSRLARERMDYLKKGFDAGIGAASVKIGLVVDKEYWRGDDPHTNREHIWFDVKEIKDGEIVAELTQDPYYVSGIKKGDVGTYSFDEITDWAIYTKEDYISPDDAYLLL